MPSSDGLVVIADHVMLLLKNPAIGAAVIGINLVTEQRRWRRSMPSPTFHFRLRHPVAPGARRRKVIEFSGQPGGVRVAMFFSVCYKGGYSFNFRTTNLGVGLLFIRGLPS